MTHLANALPAVKSDFTDTPGERDLLLTALRAASAQARLISNQIDTIQIALRHRNVTCKQAIEWLRKDRLIHHVSLPQAVGGQL
jgi:hypothetical protein